ncbi:uncharacterized protein [Drosophila takahashii]|uniref:uncharacterized protein isoform X1 n=2 Tax=Drosophila takahashii TaxID=29030 RepID=UPI001CF87682|nr:uncharacterized protein LOC108056457 isoform X1 [Drosophila takahashii]
MGRPRLVDTTNLVVVLPNRTCRCVVCDKILAGLQRSNIKRHYDRLHPNIVLQRPPRPPQQPKPQKPPSEALNTKMGRPQMVDTDKLCEVLPDGKRCRCKLCEKVLTHRPGNVRRHYNTYHPHIIVQLAPKRWVIAEDKLIPNSQRLNNPDASQLPTNSTTNSTTMETTVMVDNEEAGDGDYEDNASGSQFDIFIGKSELPDEDDNQTEESDTAVELLPITEAKPGENEPDLVPISVPKPGENEPELVAKPSTSLKASSSSGANVRASTSDCPLVAGDNAIYLQYLGNKFGKYSKRTMNTVQFHINRILYMADMGHFEEKEGNPTGESDSN